MGLHSLVSFEELCSMGCGVIEDFEDERKHHLLDLGNWEGLGQRNELEGTMHQMGVPLGHKLDPGNSRCRCCMLSRCYERDQLAFVNEPAGVEGPKTQVLHSGRGTLRLGGLRGGDGGNARRHNPMPNGGG